MNLASYRSKLDRGRPFWFEWIWAAFQALVFSSALPGSGWRRLALSAFGAKVGKGVVIKPGVRIKFPWRLEIGDHSWLGEDAWIDNLAPVRIGRSCCLSQGVYLCTGNHDWASPSFDLKTAPIALEDRVWLAAQSAVGPGVTAHEGAVLALGGVALSDLDAWTVYRGNPAVPSGKRPRKEAA